MDQDVVLMAAGTATAIGFAITALGILVVIMVCAGIALLYFARFAWRFITKEAPECQPK